MTKDIISINQDEWETEVNLKVPSFQNFGARMAELEDEAFEATREGEVNWDQIAGNWEKFKGDVKERWGRLTDDHLDVIAGSRAHLAGKIQEAYGITKEHTERQIAAWQMNQKPKGLRDIQ